MQLQHFLLWCCKCDQSMLLVQDSAATPQFASSSLSQDMQFMPCKLLGLEYHHVLARFRQRH